MLMVNHLVGFGVIPGASLVESLYDRTTGTNIGDMTLNGGLAAAWDGTTAQGYLASARAGAASGYVGKQLTAAFIVSRMIVYPALSKPDGFDGISLGASGSGTLSMYGKNSAPSNGTDGTLLATQTVTTPDNNLGPFTLTSTDTVNTYDRVWAYFNAAGSAQTYIAEVQLYIYS